jgi:hypothetical protein
MPELAGEGRRRDGQDWALGVRHAVAAHLREGQAAQRTATASPHDQHIIRAAGQLHQHPARRTPLHVRLHERLSGNLTPHRDQRLPEPLAGQVPARLPHFARRLDPPAAFARDLPGEHRDQDRIMSAGQDLPITQRVQATWRAAGPDDQPAYAEHRLARFRTGIGMAGHLLTFFCAKPACATALTATAGTTGHVPNQRSPDPGKVIS